uniref:Uncharacterized protein n=1 Tax=Anopheles atroparvus TaxID=41427 RepID=A0A182IK14_ANOAO
MIMLFRVSEVPYVLLAVLALGVLVAASFAKPLLGQNEATVGGSSNQHPEETDQYVRMGNCSGRLNLLYVETLVLAKDANSLINATIEVNLDSTLAPFAIACVRIHPSTEHDRLALAGHRFLGPKQFTIDVQEQPPQRDRNIQYEISVYRALPPRGRSSPGNVSTGS